MALKWTNKAQGALNSSADRKLRISSLTKAIGLASVFGATTALSPAAQALKTDFGVEYRATGFYVQSDAFDTPANVGSDGDNGFAHLLRVKSNFLDEDTGVSLNTSIELAGDRWSGDNRGYTPTSAQAYNTGNTGDNVRLDLAYLQVPVGHTVFRVGRQATSYNSCFLVCDDRRDRLLMIQPFSKDFQMVALYDRRQDSTTFYNPDNGDMFGLSFIGKAGDNLSGSLLFLKWLNNYGGDFSAAPGGPGAAYALQATQAMSGYITGGIGEIADLTVGFNYFTDSELDNDLTTPAVEGDFFTDSSLSQYVRLEGSVGIVDWGVQYAGAQDGGLVSSGFDTYSSLINSNPESTANPTSVYTMGGRLGLEDFEEQLIAGKLTFNLSPKMALTAGVGQLDIDNSLTDVDDSSMFYDLQLSYQVNKSLRTWVTYGILEENEAGTLTSNGLLGALPSAGFADDDVQAASVNLAVSF